jgi:hypothetical protein
VLVPKKGIVNIAKWCVSMRLRLIIFADMIDTPVQPFLAADG